MCIRSDCKQFFLCYESKENVLAASWFTGGGPDGWVTPKDLSVFDLSDFGSRANSRALSVDVIFGLGDIQLLVVYEAENGSIEVLRGYQLETDSAWAWDNIISDLISLYSSLPGYKPMAPFSGRVYASTNGSNPLDTLLAFLSLNRREQEGPIQQNFFYDNDDNGTFRCMNS